jgi:hypothetical protein
VSRLTWRASLDFLLALELLDLTALILDLGLLALQLRLGLGVLGFLVLQIVAHRKAAGRTDRATNRGSGAGRADRRTDYRTSTSTNQGAYPGAFLARRERLTRASDYANHQGRRE